MSRLDELKARDERQATALGLNRQAPVGQPAGPQPKSKGKIVAPALLLLIAIVAAIVIGVTLFINGDRNADERLAQIAKSKAGAVGFVVATHPEGRSTSATAWAVAPDLYATNAHVVAAVAKIIETGGQAQIRVNQNPNLRFPIIAAKVHPRYGDVRLGFDVGLLQIDGKAPALFAIADQDELSKLSSGYRVAYLGFPSENLFANNVKIDEPIATMQSGIITAVSDFTLGDSGFAKNQLVRHNLAAVGGASGSPIFNARGQVVAILNAGNINTQIVTSDDEEPKLGRTPSAALVNFAQRVDLLEDIMP